LRGEDKGGGEFTMQTKYIFCLKPVIMGNNKEKYIIKIIKDEKFS